MVEAALRRAGILRVLDLGELFDAAEVLARFSPLQHSRVGIVSNGGGAGVLAVDRLIDFEGILAEFSAETLARLDKALPPNWSHANPADIIGDAPPDRYSEAVRAVADDEGTDAVLVFNCPTGLASPSEAARAVAALAERGRINGKPLITCWLGEKTAREGRRILQEAGIANFSTPSSATAALSYLGEWSRAQKALTRVPSSGSEDVRGDREALAAILKGAAREGRRMLTEPEAKAAIAAYGIPVPATRVTETPKAAGEAAAELLKTSDRVVVKLLSKTISHKSDIGGVVLDLKTPQAAVAAAEGIVKRLKEAGSEDALEGFVVQPMVVRKHAHELILGVSQDPIFGPVVLFGAGGTSVEVVDDTAIALPPLDDVLAGDLIDSTRIGKLLAGYRDRAPADRTAIAGALNAMSQMIVDFPCIKGMDINPLLADRDGVVALDARVEIEPAEIDRKGPNADLAIRPYPDGWEKDVDLEGHRYHLRPIKPADVALFPGFLAQVSPQDIRFRFLASRKHFPDEMLLRLTQLDYERDMAFIALRAEDGEMGGIGRLSADPDKEIAEYGLLVRTDLQGHGLGFALLKQLIDYARAEGIGAIEGIVLSDNTKMLNMCREFGFEVKDGVAEPGVITVSLEL